MISSYLLRPTCVNCLGWQGLASAWQWKMVFCCWLILTVHVSPGQRSSLKGITSKTETGKYVLFLFQNSDFHIRVVMCFFNMSKKKSILSCFQKVDKFLTFFLCDKKQNKIFYNFYKLNLFQVKRPFIILSNYFGLVVPVQSWT